MYNAFPSVLWHGWLGDIQVLGCGNVVGSDNVTEAMHVI